MRRLLFSVLFLASCSAPRTVPWHATIQRDHIIELKSQISSHPFDIEPPFTREQAFFMLLNAPGFYPLHFGMSGGGIDVTTVAFATLARQPDAPAVFRDLLDRGTNAGKLYALCGLYLADRRALAQAALPFIDSDERVLIPYGGCVIGPKPLSAVVPHILDGSYSTKVLALSQEYLQRQKEIQQRSPSKSP